MDPQRLAEASAAAMWAGDRAAQALAMRNRSCCAGHRITEHGGARGYGERSRHLPRRLHFYLADTAFAYACNSQNHSAVAAGARIEFLAPGHLGDRLVAAARQVVQGGRTGVYDVVVSNQEGKQLALFRGNSHRIGGALVDARTGEPLNG